jgi:hypothetical protein
MTTVAPERGSAYPPAVEDLLPKAQELAVELGTVPSRNLLKKSLRIGAAKAKALKTLLQARPVPGVSPVPGSDPSPDLIEPEPDAVPLQAILPPRVVGPASRLDHPDLLTEHLPDLPPVPDSPAELDPVPVEPVPPAEHDLKAQAPAVVDPGTRVVPIAATVAMMCAVGLVAAVALVSSYDHMRILAEASGEQWRAWLVPLSVDGLAISSTLVLWIRHRQGGWGGLLPWGTLLLSTVVSVAANIATSHLEIVVMWPWVPMVVSGWSPVAAFLALHLGMTMTRDGRKSPTG